MKVAYGCCVGSWDRFNKYVVPFAGDNPILGLSGQDSIANAYNAILDAYACRGIDMLILQHDDLEIIDLYAIEKFAKAFEDPRVGLAGVAGGGATNGLAWWTVNPVGRVKYDGGVVDFGSQSGKVQVLDGCILAFSGWAIETLRFPPRSGFHGYDGNISMVAADNSMKRVVVDVEVGHHTTLDFDDAASHEDWINADWQFKKRWLESDPDFRKRLLSA